MKLKSLFSLAIGAFLLCSCNPTLNKTITEPLTAEELADMIKSNPKYADYYDKLEYVRDFVFSDALSKARYLDVSYGRYFDMMDKMDDPDFTNRLEEEVKAEWNSRFGYCAAKLDSITSYWQNYIDENGFEQYVDLTFKGVGKDAPNLYNALLGVPTDKHLKIQFSVTPLQGTIEQMTFHFFYNLKVNGTDGAKKESIVISSPFETTQVASYVIPYGFEGPLEKYSGQRDSFLRDYNLWIFIDAIKINGQIIESPRKNVPDLVLQYMDGKGDLMATTIIQQMIDSEYLDQISYETVKVREAIMKEDELCAQLLEAMGQL